MIPECDVQVVNRLRDAKQRRGSDESYSRQLWSRIIARAQVEYKPDIAPGGKPENRRDQGGAASSCQRSLRGKQRWHGLGAVAIPAHAGFFHACLDDGLAGGPAQGRL